MEVQLTRKVKVGMKTGFKFADITGVGIYRGGILIGTGKDRYILISWVKRTEEENHLLNLVPII